MSWNKCPICGIVENEWCECSPIICPHCGQIVRHFGKNGDINNCKHVIAWGTLGNGYIVWENEKYQLKFLRYCNQHLYNKEEGNKSVCDITHIEDLYLFPFAKEEGLICKCDEVVGFDYWNGAYFLFLETI